MSATSERFLEALCCMLIADFDYELPDELIAQEPLRQRDASRMLALDRAAQSWRDSLFVEFPSFLRQGDLVVLNDTRVIPARLVGERVPSGGHVELLLLREIESDKWAALARPARRLRVGDSLKFGPDKLLAEVLECLEDGVRVIRFECEGGLAGILDEVGETPLPPYIKRKSGALEKDRERYQTVYAKSRGAIAAPTAGLHFTSRVLNQIREVGAGIAEITLHVGYGTFEPVRVDDVSHHRVAPECYSISSKAATAINNARSRGGRVVAIGTTTARALESAADHAGALSSGSGMAGLTIVPGYQFRVVDALLTNFHLPRSSLLMLVSAFAGRNLILAAYHHAVDMCYRFYSYGDCVLIF
jgi:S-adenosylmethionine:tRNA ribosyltransferase-isomerase